MQNPRELAALLLQQPVEAINKGIASATPTAACCRQPVPVFMVYQTAFVDTDGTLQFRPDVYSATTRSGRTCIRRGKRRWRSASRPANAAAEASAVNESTISKKNRGKRGQGGGFDP